MHDAKGQYYLKRIFTKLRPSILFNCNLARTIVTAAAMHGGLHDFCAV